MTGLALDSVVLVQPVMRQTRTDPWNDHHAQSARNGRSPEVRESTLRHRHLVAVMTIRLSPTRPGPSCAIHAMMGRLASPNILRECRPPAPGPAW